MSCDSLSKTALRTVRILVRVGNSIDFPDRVAYETIPPLMLRPTIVISLLHNSPQFEMRPDTTLPNQSYGEIISLVRLDPT